MRSKSGPPPRFVERVSNTTVEPSALICGPGSLATGLSPGVPSEARSIGRAGWTTALASTDPR
jgi:hypothetical protein